MSCCCCASNNHLIERRILNECSCCLNDELNLYKLKNTNQELKCLINRLDHLSDSVELSYHAHKCKDVCRCNYQNTYYKECNLCRCLRQTNNTHYYQYGMTICDDCERMVRISNELENNTFKRDPNIYPLSSYPSGVQHYCDKCEKCIDESRRRQRSRSRSRSRRAYSRSSSPDFQIVTPEPRPNWNGGPWVSYYPWTNWKLKEQKN